MRLRVAWDGAAPQPGDWLASATSGGAFAITHVRRSTRRGRLLLDVTPRAASDIPPGARLHPWEQTIAIDPLGPPASRQRLQAGALAVMRAPRTDGSEAKVDASGRTRTLVGWRAFCPLRRIRAQAGSGVTDQHIAAADRLRIAADLASIGFSTPHEPGGSVTTAAGPRSGPSIGAMAQVTAAVEVGRIAALYPTSHLRMLEAILLRNASVQAWAAGEAARLHRRVEVKVEMGKLIALLDVLVLFYDKGAGRAKRHTRTLASAPAAP